MKGSFVVNVIDSNVESCLLGCNFSLKKKIEETKNQMIRNRKYIRREIFPEIAFPSQLHQHQQEQQQIREQGQLINPGSKITIPQLNPNNDNPVSRSPQDKIIKKRDIKINEQYQQQKIEDVPRQSKDETQLTKKLLKSQLSTQVKTKVDQNNLKTQKKLQFQEHANTQTQKHKVHKKQQRNDININQQKVQKQISNKNQQRIQKQMTNQQKLKQQQQAQQQQNQQSKMYPKLKEQTLNSNKVQQAKKNTKKKVSAKNDRLKVQNRVQSNYQLVKKQQYFQKAYSQGPEQSLQKNKSKLNQRKPNFCRKVSVLRNQDQKKQNNKLSSRFYDLQKASQITYNQKLMNKNSLLKKQKNRINVNLMQASSKFKAQPNSKAVNLCQNSLLQIRTQTQQKKQRKNVKHKQFRRQKTKLSKSRNKSYQIYPHQNQLKQIQQRNKSIKRNNLQSCQQNMDRKQLKQLLLVKMAQIPFSPAQRSQQISRQFLKPLMLYNPFFNRIGLNCSMNLIRNFKIQCFNKNQTIFQKNIIIKSLYIIIFGKVKLHDFQIRFIKHSLPGQTLLQEGLFQKGQARSKYSAKAISVVGVFVLPYKAFHIFKQKMLLGGLKYQISLLQTLLKRNTTVKKALRRQDQLFVG